MKQTLYPFRQSRYLKGNTSRPAFSCKRTNKGQKTGIPARQAIGINNDAFDPGICFKSAEYCCGAGKLAADMPGP